MSCIVGEYIEMSYCIIKVYRISLYTQTEFAEGELVWREPVCVLRALFITDQGIIVTVKRS